MTIVNTSTNTSDTTSERIELFPSIENPIVVVGCGAIGRQVTLQLFAAGVQNITLVDDDVVSETNIKTQGWHLQDIGRSKVDALLYVSYDYNVRFCKSICCRIGSPELDKDPIVFPDEAIQPYVFSCVDNMPSRRLIADYFYRSPFLCDGRIGGEMLRVCTTKSHAVVEDNTYWDTLAYSDAEAHGNGCTTQSTIYCANIIAGIMLAQLSKYLRKIPYSQDIQYGVLTDEIVKK